jgi:hypothetical protein
LEYKIPINSPIALSTWEAGTFRRQIVENVNNTAALFVVRVVDDVKIELTTGIMYTNIVITRDVPRKLVKTPRRLR